jgi:Ca-activated chloride channel homolog
MNLYNLWYLLLLVIVVPLIILLIFLRRRQLKRFRKYAEPQFADVYLQKYSPFYGTLKIVLIILGLVFIILALVRPQWDYEDRNFESRGLDIIICLDISRSMDATDMKPSRLQRAKLQTAAFIDRLKGDRVGIIAFAGNATIECPLTDDYKSAKMVLNALTTDLAVQEGTDIGAALTLAGKGFLTSSGSNVLLLITDGEDLGNGAVQQARRLAAANIRIYTMGVGTETGSSIRDPGTGKTAFSRLDTRSLKEIASAGNGKFYSITPSQGEIDLILQNIYTLEKGRERSKNLSALKERYQIPALIAFSLLIMESMLMPLRRKRQTI